MKTLTARVPAASAALPVPAAPAAELPLPPADAPFADILKRFPTASDAKTYMAQHGASLMPLAALAHYAHERFGEDGRTARSPITAAVALYSPKMSAKDRTALVTRARERAGIAASGAARAGAAALASL